MDFKTPALGVMRLGMGWIFFWAFLDKTFGLGWSTPAERAWIRGGSPTAGFLNSRNGWFDGLFQSLADSIVVEWLFMLGLLGVGLALLLGIGMRVATLAGVTMLLLMYLASVPFVRDGGATNPFWDSHLTQAAILVVLYAFNAGSHWGLAQKWQQVDAVKKNPWLQ